jgi:hypothetical protein
MRYFLTILMLSLSLGAFAQGTTASMSDSSDLVRSVADLNYALVNRDTIKLRFLLRDDVRYFHSNGWKQSKRDIIGDLFNGKLTYKKVNLNSESIHLMGEIAQVKSVVDIEAVMDGKPIQLRLSVIQVWAWKNEHWSLFSRHSEKI